MNGDNEDVMTLSEKSVLLVKDGKEEGGRQQWQDKGIAAALKF